MNGKIKRNLINQFNNLNLNYLNFSEYNENCHNEETYDLYINMFNEFVQPILNDLEKNNINSDHIIFNFFFKDKETNTIKGVFYDPEIEFNITYNNYENQIKEVVNLIKK